MSYPSYPSYKSHMSYQSYSSYKSNSSYMSHKSYQSNSSHMSHKSYLVLFVLLFSFFIVPANTARAATLSRPPTNLGLVGYWPMNEGVGVKAGDFSGNGNHGDINGTPVWANGKHGKALSFDGVSGYVSLPQSSTISPSSQVTVALWMNLQKVPVEAYELLSKSSGYVGYAYVTGAANATLNFGKYTGGVFHHLCEYTSCPALSYNSWHHVVYVYQSGFTGIYIDGILSASTTSMTGSIDVNSNPIMFNSRQLHKGSFDDVRIYNRVLSATEISKLYGSGAIKIKQVSNQGLVGYWPLNEGRGIKAGDSSGQNNHGTITGATWVDGKRGKALIFTNTTDQVITVSNSILDTDTHTISFWLKLNTNSAYWGQILAFRPSGTDRSPGIWAYAGANCIHWRYDPGNSGPTSCGGPVGESSYFTVGQWYHITGVKNGGTFTFYVNGSAVGSGGVPNPKTSGTSTIIMGQTGYSAPMASIDDVRVYNRALSAAEIQSLYKSGEKTENVNQNSKLTNGLVGLWSLNGQDVSGSTAYDRSSSANNGTIVGAQVTGGKVGQALDFASTYKYVTANGPNKNTGLSLGAWIFPRQYPGERSTIILGDQYYLSLYTDGSLQSYWYGTSPEGYHATSAGKIPLNQWSHVFATWDGSKMKLYVNGVLETTVDVTGLGTNPGANSFRIGAESSGRQFYGKIDEARVYNRAISPLEVQQLYNMGR